MEDRKYSEKYDCYYNSITFEWLEEVCGDVDCEFCSGRPETAKDE